MNFQFYYEKLADSQAYKDFIEKNPKAYLCSCLFILDREHSGKDNKIHFDFWLPEKKKMASFRVDGKVEFMDVEHFEKKVFEKVSTDYTFDVEHFEEMIFKKMSEEKVNGRIQKLLFSLQRLDGKDFLIMTGFLSNLGLLKANISLEEDKIILFEKKSFFDMMRVVKKKDLPKKD